LKNINQHTALIVFALSAKATAVSKKLVSSSRINNSKTTNYLHQKTLAIAKNSGIPFFVIDENQQKGDLFGQKLSFSFQTVFDLGFDYVIAIGNDCPALTSEDILKTVTLLHKNQAVLGPDKRDGAYLIGLNRDQFHFDSFAQLPWQTKDTFSSLQLYLCNPELLKVKNDFNKVSDIQDILKEALSKNFRYLLLSIIGYFQLFVFKIVDQDYKHFFSQTGFLRGPPRCVPPLLALWPTNHCG